MKIAIILGTRPEIIKLSPVIRECLERKLDFFILHTNQHYSPNMDQDFFSELSLPQPKYNLGIKESLHGQMTGKMLIGIEPILISEKPDWVFVQGDTNTVLAGALAASKLGIKVAHIEAGLRSYDRSMPEEINRILTDHVSEALFCPTFTQSSILQGEGITKGKIFISGNTIVDAALQNLALATRSPLATKYKGQAYMLLTLHRPSNVDDKSALVSLMAKLEDLSLEFSLPIYFPVHPRTEAKLKEFNIILDPKIIIKMPPANYLEMLILEQNAKLILTDSGGVQEEACILKIPCVTIRDNTERPETLEVGGGMLYEGIPNLIKSAKKMIEQPRTWGNPFGDGSASTQIINKILGN